jgi:hypothetical protein
LEEREEEREEEWALRASLIVEPTVGYKLSVMSSIVTLEPTCTI